MAAMALYAGTKNHMLLDHDGQRLSSQPMNMYDDREHVLVSAGSGFDYIFEVLAIF